MNFKMKIAKLEKHKFDTNEYVSFCFVYTKIFRRIL